MEQLKLPDDYYKRDINIITGYVDQQTIFIQRMTGCSAERAREHVLSQINPKVNTKVRDPDVRMLAKDKNMDRYTTVVKFTKFLKNIISNDHILAPTLTVYISPLKVKSYLAKYIGINMRRRNEMKALMFKAKRSLNKPLETFYNLLQSTFKIKNNSLSGAHASKGNVLHNKSSHSTLTSGCRTATSYANMHNEKFLMGNRHYWSPDVTISNMLSIIDVTDHSLFEKTMTSYELHYPTVDEALECILYSTRNYWTSEDSEQLIKRLIVGMSPLERAMVVYIGDLYHLAKHNDQVVRTLFDRFVRIEPKLTKNPDDVINTMNSEAIALITLFNSNLVKGRSIWEIKESGDVETYNTFAGYCESMTGILSDYHLLIKGLWLTKNVPCSVYTAPTLYRKCAVISDTDSTIFTNQYWTSWYVGKIDFSEESYRIGYTTTFMTSQIVKHLLVIMSSNLGVVKSSIRNLTMKSEFYFPLLCQTLVAKHYFSYISACEGNPYPEFELEVKGVNLRSSNWPADIADGVKDYMKYLMDMIMNQGVFTIYELLSPINAIENKIIESIKSGSPEYLTTVQIKDITAYKDADGSPYAHYLLWKDVFAPKYGECMKPPYQSVKVSLNLRTKSEVARWLDSIEDKELADRMRMFLASTNKTSIETMRLPETSLIEGGIPTELIPVLNIRQMLYSTVSGYYMVMQSMGYSIIDRYKSRLVSDIFREMGLPNK